MEVNVVTICDSCNCKFVITFRRVTNLEFRRACHSPPEPFVKLVIHKFIFKFSLVQMANKFQTTLYIPLSSLKNIRIRKSI